MRRERRFVQFVVLVVLVAGSWADAAAQIKPGDIINPQNAEKIKNLVSPGVYFKVQHGMTMKIVPTQRIDWPPPYKDATEKYSSQVRLSNDHRTVVGYVAGQPFPLIDANDPDVAMKIIWNNVFRPIINDDYDLRFYDCYSHYQSKTYEHNATVMYWQIGHYAGYQMVGRTEVEPMPIDPDFKISNRFWMFGLYPFIAPAEWRGIGFMRYRYANPKRGDDAWVYLPASRRLRRESEAAMSITSAPAGGWEPDHFSGFNAKTEEYNYRFLGEREMLGLGHAEHSPVQPCESDGGASTCPENWEMRHVYVVEITPRREVNYGSIFSKTLIYLDSEMWFEPYIDKYDAKGQLWHNQIYWVAYRDRPVPDAKVAIYPFKRLFVVGAVSTDLQSSQATMCYLPGREVPERECWYINMGAVDKEFFTTQAMVKAGH